MEVELDRDSQRYEAERLTIGFKAPLPDGWRDCFQTKPSSTSWGTITLGEDEIIRVENVRPDQRHRLVEQALPAMVQSASAKYRP